MTEMKKNRTSCFRKFMIVGFLIWFDRKTFKEAKSYTFNIPVKFKDVKDVLKR
jgi:hypothetical protein